MQIEICVESLDSALASQMGGGARVELCSALREGGLTPSPGLIRSVRAALTIQIFVMIRPRSGNFVYSENEYHIMQSDIASAKELGCDGVVLGLMTPNGDVDVPRTRKLIELSRPAQVTFHRAFDEARDLDEALEAVIDCGADRILTSGGASSAYAGIPALARLQERARGRIQVMAGGGVRPNNVTGILRLTGIRAVHSAMVSLPEKTDEWDCTARNHDWPTVNADEVAELCRKAEEALDSHLPAM